MQLNDVDILSIIVIVIVFVVIIISAFMARKHVIFKITNIVMGLLFFVILIFTLLIYFAISFMPGDFVIGTNDLPIIILILVVVVGIASYAVYDWVLSSRLGYILPKAFQR